VTPKAASRAADLFGDTQSWQTKLYKNRLAMNVMVGAHPAHFRKDFQPWLQKNFHVWDAFCIEADRMWDAGWRHYSARTIWHWLRHQSNIKEAPNEHGWKINNNYSTDAGRLWMLMHPDRDGFFERRVSPLGLRAA
jgi:hypothetical protein